MGLAAGRMEQKPPINRARTNKPVAHRASRGKRPTKSLRWPYPRIVCTQSPVIRIADGRAPLSSNKASPSEQIVDQLLVGHAADVLAGFVSGCIDLIVTSPPYWTAVEYEGVKNSWASYEDYLADIQSVWRQCARVLRPNGKLCINAPIMPIPKDGDRPAHPAS